MVNLVASTEHESLDAVFKPKSGLSIKYPNICDKITTGGGETFTMPPLPLKPIPRYVRLLIFIPAVSADQTAEYKKFTSVQFQSYSWPSDGKMKAILSQENQIAVFMTGGGGS